jgi:hypothetical protein
VKAKDFIDKWLQYTKHDLSPHLLIVGRTGSGKTTAAKHVIARACAYYSDIIVLDWSAEYNTLPGFREYDPPFPIAVEETLVDAVAEVERQEGGGHMLAYFLKKALLSTLNFAGAAEKLRSIMATEITSYALRAAAEAALARLEILSRYVTLTNNAHAPGLARGVYNLSEIASVWERSAIRQFLSVYHIAARGRQAALAKRYPAAFDPPEPSILLIEEGSVGATMTYLNHIMVEARRALCRIVFVSQRLPEEHILQSTEILLFDTSPAIRRALHAAIPDSRLRVGEAWWVRRDGEAKRISFRD